MIRRLIQEVASRAQEALARSAAQRRRMHGMNVWVMNDHLHASTEEMFGKVAAALDLVAQVQPWRIRAMQQDFSRIFVRQNTGVRAMFDLERSCVLDTYFVAKFAPAQVASSIVHEGVHARLRRGGRTMPANLIAWEERLCRKAELGFGLRVPGGEAVVERARSALALSDADVAPLAGNIRLRDTRRGPRTA